MLNLVRRWFWVLPGAAGFTCLGLAIASIMHGEWWSTLGLSLGAIFLADLAVEMEVRQNPS